MAVIEEDEESEESVGMQDYEGVNLPLEIIKKRFEAELEPRKQSEAAFNMHEVIC